MRLDIAVGVEATWKGMVAILVNDLVVKNS